MNADSPRPLVGVLDRLWQSLRAHRARWRWLGFGLTAAAVVYLAYSLIESGAELRNVIIASYAAPALVALGVYLLSLVAQFAVWARMISFHRQVGWEDGQIYFRSVLMRRLPGGPWHWVGRTAMYSSATDLPPRVSAAGSLVEWVLILLVGGGMYLAVVEGVPSSFRLPLVSIVVTIALAVAFQWQPRSRRWVLRVVEAALWLLLYVVAWLSGLAIFLLIAGAAGAQLDWVSGMRVWMIAAGMGVVTVVLPFTLGVQEAALVALMQPFLDPLLGIVLAVVIRLIYMSGDALWGLLGWKLSRAALRRKQQAASTDNPLAA